jgi:hypothetical protein
MKIVEMFPVASSRISEMGYDAETATIYVRFTDGRSWCYMNVPQDVGDGGSIRGFTLKGTIYQGDFRRIPVRTSWNLNFSFN